MKWLSQRLCPLSFITTRSYSNWLTDQLDHKCFIRCFQNRAEQIPWREAYCSQLLLFEIITLNSLSLPSIKCVPAQSLRMLNYKLCAIFHKCSFVSVSNPYISSPGAPCSNNLMEQGLNLLKASSSNLWSFQVSSLLLWLRLGFEVSSIVS